MVFFVGPLVPILDPSHIVRGVLSLAEKFAKRARFHLTNARSARLTRYRQGGMRNIAARLAPRDLVGDAKFPQELLRLKLMCCIFLHSSIFF
jgi:hypothetical protein